jgi:hypothetical protein
MDTYRNAATPPLSACLYSVDSPEGRQRVADLLESGAFPHYQPHPDRPGLLVRINAGGQRAVGRFVRCQFQPFNTRTNRW